MTVSEDNCYRLKNVLVRLDTVSLGSVEPVVGGMSWFCGTGGGFRSLGHGIVRW